MSNANLDGVALTPELKVFDVGFSVCSMSHVRVCGRLWFVVDVIVEVNMMKMPKWS